VFQIGFFLFLILSLILPSCTEKPEELNLDQETEALVSILQDELVPLDTDPLSWADQDLRWLDPIAGKSVVALGESTHGTAEFIECDHVLYG